MFHTQGFLVLSADRGSDSGPLCKVDDVFRVKNTKLRHEEVLSALACLPVHRSYTL